MLVAALLVGAALLVAGCSGGDLGDGSGNPTARTSTTLGRGLSTPSGGGDGQSSEQRAGPSASPTMDPASHSTSVMGGAEPTSLLAPGVEPTLSTAVEGVTGSDDFSVTLHTRLAGTVQAVVHPMAVAAGTTTVSPPEPAGCPWNSALQVAQRGTDVPVGCDWTDTSVWIENAAYPRSPPSGTTYIYGHACLYHICPFSAVKQTSDGLYTVGPGDSIMITTRAGTLAYLVCAVAASPKAGPAQQPVCNGGVDLDIITCRFDTSGTSLDNIIIAATLDDAQ